MTKAENRAAAKAWHQERQARYREEERRKKIAVDLERLQEFRWYFMLHRKVLDVQTDALIAAIDDYAERLTGDRRALHLKAHSIP
jgi:hypothetical protein